VDEENCEQTSNTEIEIPALRFIADLFCLRHRGRSMRDDAVGGAARKRLGDE
jgi:hypothetical protein